ncbi:hypothetical protein SCHPADRAFT_766015 [Schizopora paradoxa]|uniref:Uncharacterized protein n=1 Tax=Schizopora paradoxa TaxID=27342 RepID=A0A0H2QY33_9AGAM|nr:hypothetical protein SCHPADRAFT_766015 [Schizopora paradoxa]
MSCYYLFRYLISFLVHKLRQSLLSLRAPRTFSLFRTCLSMFCLHSANRTYTPRWTISASNLAGVLLSITVPSRPIVSAPTGTARAGKTAQGSARKAV